MPPVAVHCICLDFGEVAGGDNDDEHEEDENDHDVHAERALHFDFVGSAPSVGAACGQTLCRRFTLVEVFFHALIADGGTARAVPEGATRLIRTAVIILCASLHALHDGRAAVG